MVGGTHLVAQDHDGNDKDEWRGMHMHDGLASSERFVLYVIIN